MPVFDRDTLVAFAQPVGGRLREILAPLTGIAPAPPLARFTALRDEHDLAALAASLDDDPPPPTAATGGPLEPPGLIAERGLWGQKPAPSAVGRVFDNYRRRLPRGWSRWLEWTQWIYASTLSPSMPMLLEVFEALIAVEAQLQVDAAYPNRDHIVHQLADAELAVALYDHALAANSTFDAADWQALVACAPEVDTLSPEERRAAARCGLALAGMFHDVGYLRYLGTRARLTLAANFGMEAPGPGFAPWDIALAFHRTYVNHVLQASALPIIKRPGPTLAVDVYGYAWDHQWHGPLAAHLLCGVTRRLVAEGRCPPIAHAALQIAAAAAFFHELHDVDQAKDPNRHATSYGARPLTRRRPTFIELAERCTASLRWPMLFRFVDEAQCWMRPTLGPATASDDGATVTFGAKRAELDTTTFTIWAGTSGTREIENLRRLSERNPGAFAALGITNVCLR